MPYGHNPNRFVFHPVEEPMGFHNNSPVWKVGKIRDMSPGFRILLETRDDFLSLLTEIKSSRRVVTVNLGERFKELAASGRGKKDFQDPVVSRNRSASFSTSASS